MEKVTGIGGVFFGARDPDQLSAWYDTHLGIDPVPQSYGGTCWWQQAGPTVFTAMAADSPALGDPPRSWAINFRVADLDAMVRQLRDGGIDVMVHPETYPNGRFAELRDPEGNPIQLWEPTEDDLRR
jgi:glyoxylase I family protein